MVYRVGLKEVTIEVPEEIARLVERVPWLKRVLAQEGVEGILRRLEKQAQLDLLTPETGVTEEDIMEMDRIIKRGLSRRLENELPRNSGGHQ